MPCSIGKVAFLKEVIHGMNQHQDDKHLSGNVMELPEKPPIGNQCRDLFHVLKHISHWPIIKSQDDPRNQAKDQGGKTQSGQVGGDFSVSDW